MIRSQIYLFLLSSIFLLSGNANANAQQGQHPGEWRTYLSHNNPQWSVELNGFIYTITRGGLVRIDPESQEVKTYSTTDGLRDVTPTAIYADKVHRLIFLGYETGAINYFSDPSDIHSLSQVERADAFTQKKINDFAVIGDRLIVATDFGIVIYNTTTWLSEVDVSQIGGNGSKLPVLSVDVSRGRVWAAMGKNGLFSALNSSSNFRDPASWLRVDGINGLPKSDTAEVLQIVNRFDQPYVMFKKGVFTLGVTQWARAGRLSRNREHRYMDVNDDNLIVSDINSSAILTKGGNIRTIFPTEGGILHGLVIGDDVLFSVQFGGFQWLHDGEYQDFTPKGPPTNNSQRLAAGNGELYVAPKGHDGSTNPIYDNSGVYYFNEGSWKVLRKDQGLPPDGRVGLRFSRATYDEKTGLAYLGTWGQGMLVLKSGEVQDFYDCANSELSFINGVDCNLADNTATRVAGMQVDANGNLWVGQSLAQEPLAMRTPSGEWFSFPVSLFPNMNMIEMLVDDYGNKWMVNRLNGIYVFNDNGTPAVLADDKVVKLTATLNRGDLPTDAVRSLAKDHDGFIWVGTDAGVTVFFDPFSISQGTLVDASCPVYLRHCLLKDESVNAIKVDGGNRKWMATNSGVFLIGEDGDEVIQNFTTENSPLLSNLVLDIAIDGSTGEVFFATSKGIISYQGDATTPTEKCNDVIVFPNPVKPDYDGSITIRGSSANSKVRVTTASGVLVKELTAHGGTAIWDGIDLYGNRVSSGVYLTLSSDKDGKKGCVGKFVIIR